MDEYDEIASLFSKGMVRWLKATWPILYQEMTALEKEIEKASMGRDEGKVEDLVKRYKDFVLKVKQGYDERSGRRKR